MSLVLVFVFAQAFNAPPWSIIKGFQKCTGIGAYIALVGIVTGRALKSAADRPDFLKFRCRVGLSASGRLRISNLDEYVGPRDDWCIKPILVLVKVEGSVGESTRRVSDLRKKDKEQEIESSVYLVSTYLELSHRSESLSPISAE